MRARKAGTDQGSATVWSVGAVAVLCLVFGVVLALGQAVVARHRAAGGADLAALAAAEHWARGATAACARAERIAAAQETRLVRCALTGQVSDVTVASGRGPFTAEVRARAGPPPERPPAGAAPEGAASARAVREGAASAGSSGRVPLPPGLSRRGPFERVLLRKGLLRRVPLRRGRLELVLSRSAGAPRVDAALVGSALVGSARCGGRRRSPPAAHRPPAVPYDCCSACAPAVPPPGCPGCAPLGQPPSASPLRLAPLCSSLRPILRCPGRPGAAPLPALG
ncbi:Rv3654c family TadE-like protein [Streptomyces rochei]|uniref:Rv3654c family TadE-like protein n=1 Tax=Streptomyces rochei TaxID=1928 RepID=UPI0036326338